MTHRYYYSKVCRDHEATWTLETLHAFLEHHLKRQPEKDGKAKERKTACAALRDKDGNVSQVTILR